MGIYKKTPEDHCHLRLGTQRDWNLYIVLLFETVDLVFLDALAISFLLRADKTQIKWQTHKAMKIDSSGDVYV